MKKPTTLWEAKYKALRAAFIVMAQRQRRLEKETEKEFQRLRQQIRDGKK